MDGVGAGIAKLDLLSRGLDLRFIADQKNRRDTSIGFERAFDAFDDDRATVVATHDIHCYSHNGKGRGITSRASLTDQAPAVTVMTWRPL